MDPLGFGLENYDAVGALARLRRTVCHRRLRRAARRPDIQGPQGQLKAILKSKQDHSVLPD